MRLLAALPLILTAMPAAAQTGPVAAGGFPTNTLTSREHGGPQGSAQQASITALQQTLTELQQLQLQTKQAHWNVSGTLYYPLHELLQDHYEGVAKYVDAVDRKSVV